MVALAGLLACLAAGATPELQSVFLSFGRTRSLAANTWATLTYVLRNPADEGATLRLRLVPEEGATAIFEQEVTIPAGRFVNGREMVTVSPCQKYRLEVFQGDRRAAAHSVLAHYSDPATRCQAFFLDDSPDFEGASELGKTPELLRRVAQTKVPAGQAPTHWAGYDDSSVVVVARPDYAHFGSDRCAALVEYVHRGGTLVFLVPEGVLGAAATPLGDLLPVAPLRMRLVEDVPELDAWGAEAFGPHRARRPFASSDGIPFLESSPRGEGVTTLAQDGYPVVRWRREGLGRVGVVAVNPCDRLARESGCFVAVWNHILAWSQAPYSLSYRENNTHVPSLMAHLTGYRIPGIRRVALLLFGYAGVMTVLLVGGYALRRHATVWIAAASLGLTATALVFFGAYRANAHRPRRGAAILSFATTSGERAAGQAILSLQSRTDVRPTLAGQEPDVLLRGLPSVTRDKRKQSGDAPVLVRRSAERSSTPGIDVAALKPRTLAAVFTPAPRPAPPQRLLLGADGLALAAGEVPDWLAGERLQAFALLPNGIRRVRLGEGRIQSLVRDPSALRPDPFANLLSEWLGSGRFPTPSLAFVRPVGPNADVPPLDLAGFVPQGYAVHFLPLGVTVAGNTVEIPPSCIAAVPHDSATRTYLASQEVAIVRQPEQWLEFAAVLPPWLADLRPERVELTVRANNPGGNLATEIRLGLPEQQEPPRPGAALHTRMRAAWDAGTPPTTSRGNAHTFAGLPPALLSPATGRFRILLRLAQKQIVRDSTAMDRLNSWRFDGIQIRLTGHLPEQREL